MSANILATVVAAVFLIRGGTPTGQLIGGDATQAFTQAQGASQTITKTGSSTITSQGATQEFNP
jgi:preprotein translocase subunit SecG